MPNHLRSLQLLPLLAPALAFAQDAAPTGSSADSEPNPSVAQVEPADNSANTLSATATYVYLTGDYGLATDTDVFAGILALEHDAARWRVRGDVSVLTIDGPSTVGTGGATAGARPSTDRTTGLGDTNLEATWKFMEPEAARQIDLTGRVKLPTADESRGLGTGEFDYYVQVDVSQRINTLVVFGNLGWQFLGDSARYQLDDGPYATVGLAGPLGDALTAGAGLNWRSDTGGGADDALDSFVFVSRDLDEQWRAVLIGIVGFTDASPDLGAGLSLAYTF